MMLTLSVLLSLLTWTAKAIEGEDVVFVKGIPLVGGTNGMFFDTDNNLYVAQVLGRKISKLNPETGEILEQLGEESSVFFADDVTIGPNGTLYWTDILLGTIFSNAPPFELYAPGTYPNSNPLTLSDDGNRLFFAQCFYTEGLNGVFQLDLVTNETTTIFNDVPLCGSNAMDFHNESLYSPRLFEGRVIRIDLADNNRVTNLTTGMGYPVAVKLDSQGRLFALDAAVGQVVRIDLDNRDTENNREVVAELPFTGLDNLAFDKDDRLYVSSFSRGSVTEVVSANELRTVSPGGYSVASGIAVLGDTVYTVNPLALHGFDAETGEENYFVEGLPLANILPPQPSSVVAWGENLVLISFLTNFLAVWDLQTRSVLQLATFEGPNDAHPFRGGLLIAEILTGNVVNATGTDLSDRQVIATTPGARCLAGDDDNVYVSDQIAGEVLQIISDGAVLDPPVRISTGHDNPEGIALVPGGEYLLVVAAGSGTLEQVNLATGEVTAIATGLGFLPPLLPVVPFGFLNDVAVHNEYAFVNGDGANVIYKLKLEEDASVPTGTPASSSPTTLAPAFAPASAPTTSFGVKLMNVHALLAVLVPACVGLLQLV